MLCFLGLGFFFFSLRHGKRSAIGFDATKLVAEEMENYDSEFFIFTFFFKQVAACLYSHSKHRPKQL